MTPTTFPAVVQKVQTLADGGLRFTFDASETEVLAAAELMEAKRLGVMLRVTVAQEHGQDTTIGRTETKRRVT